jgi:hypothetical protein
MNPIVKLSTTSIKKHIVTNAKQNRLGRDGLVRSITFFLLQAFALPVAISFSKELSLFG